MSHANAVRHLELREKVDAWRFGVGARRHMRRRVQAYLDSMARQELVAAQRLPQVEELAPIGQPASAIAAATVLDVATAPGIAAATEPVVATAPDLDAALVALEAAELDRDDRTKQAASRWAAGVLNLDAEELESVSGRSVTPRRDPSRWLPTSLAPAAAPAAPVATRPARSKRPAATREAAPVATRPVRSKRPAAAPDAAPSDPQRTPGATRWLV